MDPAHPVIALATRRIEELNARRQAITEAIDKVKVARPAGGHLDEFVDMLDAVPDLRDALTRGEPEELAAI